MNTKYYMVRIDKKSWTKDAVSLDSIESQGLVVRKARRGGDMDAFLSGRKVAVLFERLIDAAAYVAE